MNFTIHKYVCNVIGNPDPTQYAQIDKYTVKNTNRDWSEIGPKSDFSYILLFWAIPNTGRRHWSRLMPLESSWPAPCSDCSRLHDAATALATAMLTGLLSYNSDGNPIVIQLDGIANPTRKLNIIF